MAQVLRDANSSSFTEYTTIDGAARTHTLLTIGNRVNLGLIVQIVWSADPGATTCTWGAQSCTEIIKAVAAGGRAASLFGLVNPTQGNQTITVDPTNACGSIINATSYYNVDQTGGSTTFRNAVSNTGNSANPTVTIASADDEMTVDCEAVPGAVGTPTKTLLFFFSGAGPEDGGASESRGAASVLHSWTVTSGQWVDIGCSIRNFPLNVSQGRIAATQRMC